MYYFHKISPYKENFDFFDSSLPENNLSFAFGDQLNRARVLLKGRSRSQIHYIFESLDWMLQEGDKALYETTITEVEAEGEAFINRVKALKSYAEKFDIADQESLPNATWTDYFAALSLVTILEALHPENFPEPFQDYGHPMEAMEAVCIAEFYKDLAINSNLQLKKRGRAGGLKRSRKFNTLINKVLTQYENDPEIKSLSNRKASYAIFAGPLQKEIENTLNTDEPEKRIEIWIGKYKNGHLKIT